MKIKEQIKKYLATKNKTILTKYTSIVIPVILGLVVLIDVLVFSIVTTIHYNNTRKMASQIVVKQTQSLKNIFDGYFTDLFFLKKEFQDGINPRDFLDKSQQLLQGSPLRHDYISISYPISGESYKSDSKTPSLDFKTEKSFEKIVRQNKKSYITLPQELGKNMFEVSVPILSEGDSIRAIISIGFNSSEIDSLLSDTKIYGYGHIVLGNYDHNFRIYYDDKIVNASAQEMEQKGYKGITDFVDKCKFDEPALYHIGSYTTNNNQTIKAVLSVIQGSEVGISMNTPATYLYMLPILVSLLLLVITIIIVLCLRLLIKKITNSFVVKPLNNIQQITTDFAEGKIYMDKTTEEDHGTEFTTLTQSVGKMQNKVSDTVKLIRNISNTISKGNKKLKHSIKTISSEAQTQVMYGNQIHDLIEKMTVSIQQNTQNALHTKEFTDTVATNMNNVTLASENTLKSIRIVMDKLKVIDEISERTDLLAINAAVEASRAGENGKGFGVVASEIRKLAEHCLEASTEINESSKWSVKTTNQAVELVQQILPNIKEIAEKVSKISDICNRQLDMTYSISMTIMRLVSIAANNSDSAIQISEYSDKLTQKINELDEATNFFKIHGSDNNPTKKIIEEIQNRTSEILKLKTELLSLEPQQIEPQQQDSDQEIFEPKVSKPTEEQQETTQQEDQTINIKESMPYTNHYNKGADIKLDDEYTEY